MEKPRTIGFNTCVAPMNHAGNFTPPSGRLCLAAMLLLGTVFWTMPQTCRNHHSRAAASLVLPARPDQDTGGAFLLRLPITVMVHLLSGRRP